LTERASADDAVAWSSARPRRQVAGVLGDLGLAGLTLLLEGLERGITTTRSCRMMLA
jgi:hypothetical protein